METGPGLAMLVPAGVATVGGGTLAGVGYWLGCRGSGRGTRDA